MTIATGLLLAVLSIWDYPSRQPAHEQLRSEFMLAIRRGDFARMELCAAKGVELLPDDPTWRYNLACALSRGNKREAAITALEKAIELGFRDSEAIASDSDFMPIVDDARFRDAVATAARLKNRPLLTGPLAVVPAMGFFGQMQTLGAHNLGWDFDAGAFDAKLTLVAEGAGGNLGDLYFNRDGGHSLLAVTNFPGLTRVRFDEEGRSRGMDLDFPNVLFPYPVFGNASRALVSGPYRRSIPRAMMSSRARWMKTAARFYVSNQIWAFPAVMDYPNTEVETICSNDVFASVAPYWIATAGRSWSDQYYLRAALEISRSLHVVVKKQIVSRGLLAPTVQTLLRRSLKTVEKDGDYLTSRAHPTCFPRNGLDLKRMKELASSMSIEAIPPVAAIREVAGIEPQPSGSFPELTYATPFAWAVVLRSSQTNRVFSIRACGAEEYAFALVHDERQIASLERTASDCARVTIDRRRMTTTNRVDVAVFARNPGSFWGAPAFVSFAVVDPDAVYSDPVLTPRTENGQ